MRPLTTAALVLSLLLVSCQKPEVATAPAADPAVPLKAAYALCSEYGDLAAAAPLAYQLAAIDTENSALWKEELAKIHHATGRHAIALNILNDLVANHGRGDKLPVLEMTALSREALGQNDQAIDAWESVYELEISSIYAMRLAGLHLLQGRVNEAERMIFAGLAAEDIHSSTIELPKTNEVMQQIPVSAALRNLMAQVILKRDPTAIAAAKAELEAALALAPDYEIAKRNLAGLNSPAPALDATANEP